MHYRSLNTLHIAQLSIALSTTFAIGKVLEDDGSESECHYWKDLNKN